MTYELANLLTIFSFIIVSVLAAFSLLEVELAQEVALKIGKGPKVEVAKAIGALTIPTWIALAVHALTYGPLFLDEFYGMHAVLVNVGRLVCTLILGFLYLKMKWRWGAVLFFLAASSTTLATLGTLATLFQ